MINYNNSNSSNSINSNSNRNITIKVVMVVIVVVVVVVAAAVVVVVVVTSSSNNNRVRVRGCAGLRQVSTAGCSPRIMWIFRGPLFRGPHFKLRCVDLALFSKHLGKTLAAANLSHIRRLEVCHRRCAMAGGQFQHA